MRTPAILLILLVLASAFIQAESKLNPPTPKNSPAPTASPAETMPTDIVGLLNTAAESLASGSVEDCIAKMAVLYLVQIEVSPHFLGERFPETLANLGESMEKLQGGICRTAKDAALSFIRLRTFLLTEGYDTEAARAEIAAVPQVTHIARSGVSLKRLPEDLRIASLRTLHLLGSQLAAQTAGSWLKAENSSLRLAAINLLGRLGNAAFEKDFSKLSRETDISVELRIEYALASARLGGAGSSVLRELLLAVSVPVAYRLRCIESLAALGRASAETAFAALLNSEGTDVRVLSAAMEWMAGWGTPELGAHLQRFLASKDANLRRSAVTAVGTMKAIRLLPDVSGILLDTKDPATKVACLRCISDCEAKNLMGTVAEYLYDESFPVRLEAALAVQGLSGRRFDLVRSASPDDQQRKIQNIRRWWQENQSKE
jgi:HEAT repeat protein